MLLNNSLNRFVRAAIFAALSVIFVYLACVLPTGRLTLLVLSSLLMMLSLMTCGIKSSFCGFAAAGILMLFLVPHRIYAVSYLAFFGLYPFIKLFCEQLKHRFWEYGIKVLYALILLFGAYFTIHLFFFAHMLLAWFSKIGIYPIYILVFLLYDLLCSYAFGYLKRIGNRNGI